MSFGSSKRLPIRARCRVRPIFSAGDAATAAGTGGELYGMLMNALRVPGTTPTVYAAEVDRILFPGDFDPDFYWYFDDLWTDPIDSVRTENPPRRNLSKGYKTLLYTIHHACQHFSARISKLNSTELLEISRFTVIWDPDSGA